MKYLKQLDLSGNLLENIHIDVFEDLSDLEDLSYSNNRLSSFNISVLNANFPLVKLNLSHNMINSLERSSQHMVTSLKVLDLSYNNLTYVYDDFLKAVPRVEYLDFSFNRLSELEANALMHLQYLKILRINDNRLLSLSFQDLPLRLEELHAGGNFIGILLPKKISIRVLNIENNRISDLREEFSLLEELMHLNISGNFLSEFPSVKLKHLESLDLSFNNLTIIPKSISTNFFPMLKIFNVSGNPLQDLKLQSELKLNIFEANYMDMIEGIHEDTFEKLKGRANECINVTISNNNKLSVMAENAFHDINMCFVSISC
ncbi:Malignant fibrous histiocytoma-amplified sequence 1 [Harpegnathos saltator]|uniref:Malignant fibrous histiocytoma-amplified sequence 1 n=1 Tax=Harpegnathos saltator TaxID=610380 RepID=E2C148_HARSA|nr:Malignant fibrous histiocytoma-amplified sequence 1 [Harpegnathos saltator]